MSKQIDVNPHRKADTVAAALATRENPERTPRVPLAGETDHHRKVAMICTLAGYASSLVAGRILGRVLGEPEGKTQGLYANVVADEMMATMFDEVKPTNMVERMLVEQMVMTHAQIMAANQRATGTDAYDRIEQCLAMTGRLMADFRKTAATLKELRTPPRQVIIAQQVNHADGDQTITGPGQPKQDPMGGPPGRRSK